MESSLLDPMLAIANGDGLDDWAESGLRWRAGAAVTTVVASAGYPGAYETGAAITIPSGLEEADDLVVFHAGTVSHHGAVLSTGGRVLAVTGLGADVALAAARSRDAASSIEFSGAQFRRDIAWREIARNR
jgi:phosphoribosylamine--glycine ligase